MYKITETSVDDILNLLSVLDGKYVFLYTNVSQVDYPVRMAYYTFSIMISLIRKTSSLTFTTKLICW